MDDRLKKIKKLRRFAHADIRVLFIYSKIEFGDNDICVDAKEKLCIYYLKCQSQKQGATCGLKCPYDIRLYRCAADVLQKTWQVAEADVHEDCDGRDWVAPPPKFWMKNKMWREILESIYKDHCDDVKNCGHLYENYVPIGCDKGRSSIAVPICLRSPLGIDPYMDKKKEKNHVRKNPGKQIAVLEKNYSKILTRLVILYFQNMFGYIVSQNLNP